VFSSSWNSITDTGRTAVDLINTITQCYLLLDTSEHTPPRQSGRYSTYLPRSDGRLSWPTRLVTCRKGLLVYRVELKMTQNVKC